MQVILWIIVIALVISLLSAIWPLFVALAVIFILWKIYELYYYKSSSFLEIKQRINAYTNDCNELNQHIESLKDTNLISNKTDYGNASY